MSKSGSEPVHGKVHLIAQPLGQETPRVRRAIASKSMRPVVLPPLSRVSTGLTAEQAEAFDGRRFVSRRGLQGATGAGVQDRRPR